MVGAASTRSTTPGSANPGNERLVPLAVLWIDDETAILDYAATLLARNGFEIMVATTGSMGLAFARERHFDLIVLDLGLPDVSGLEVLRQKHARESHTPVVILTAFPSDTSAFEAGYLGAARYLRKPLVGSRLLDALRSAVTDIGGATRETPLQAKWSSSRDVLAAALPLLQRIAAERSANPAGAHQAVDSLIAHFVDGDVSNESLALPQFATLARVIRLLIEPRDCSDSVLRLASELIDRAVGFDLATCDPCSPRLSTGSQIPSLFKKRN